MEYAMETSVYDKDEEELEQEPSGETNDPEDRDEEDDDAKFSDAESIQLDEEDEEVVLTIRKQGGGYIKPKV